MKVTLLCHRRPKVAANPVLDVSCHRLEVRRMDVLVLADVVIGRLAGGGCGGGGGGGSGGDGGGVGEGGREEGRELKVVCVVVCCGSSYLPVGCGVS